MTMKRQNVTASLMGDPPPHRNAAAVRAPVETEEAEVPNFGPQPTMCWLPKTALKIDARYQREIKSARSKRLIRRLRQNWRWYHCAPLIVSNNGNQTYNVLDGQHRMSAAMGIKEISLLPAYVVDELTLAQQADAFVAHNSDRVTVSPHAIFHAKAVGGDEAACAILRACRAADVEVLRSSGGNKSAKQTGALAVLREIYGTAGAEALTAALSVVRQAYPDRPGQLTSHMIYAVWKALGKAERGAVVAALSKTDDNTLRIEARMTGLADKTIRLRDSYAAALLSMIGKQ